MASGLSAGFPVPLIVESVHRSIYTGIAEARAFSRDAGIKRLRAEALTLDVELFERRSAVHDQAVRDLIRGRVTADNYARRWQQRAVGDSVAEAAAKASAETEGSIRRIAVTESSQSFNSGRLAAARASGLDLFRRWDAQADACPVCAMADGTVVGVNEPFPEGEPGSVHPNCNCDWELISAEEAGEDARDAENAA